jgi:hypothetical protein
MDIHSKETKCTSHEKTASHKISQYSTSATNRIQGTINRMQDTKHRKKNRKTTKHENKEKLLPGIEPGPTSL